METRINFVKLKKLWPYVNGMHAKPIAPTIAQIATKVVVLLIVGIDNIVERDDKDEIAIQVLNNFLLNNVVSNV
jgi:hypothetical protein